MLDPTWVNVSKSLTPPASSLACKNDYFSSKDARDHLKRLLWDPHSIQMHSLCPPATIHLAAAGLLTQLPTVSNQSSSTLGGQSDWKSACDHQQWEEQLSKLQAQLAAPAGPQHEPDSHGSPPSWIDMLSAARSEALREALFRAASSSGPGLPRAALSHLKKACVLPVEALSQPQTRAPPMPSGQIFGQRSKRNGKPSRLVESIDQSWEQAVAWKRAPRFVSANSDAPANAPRHLDNLNLAAPENARVPRTACTAPSSLYHSDIGRACSENWHAEKPWTRPGRTIPGIRPCRRTPSSKATTWRSRAPSLEAGGTFLAPSVSLPSSCLDSRPDSPVLTEVIGQGLHRRSVPPSSQLCELPSLAATSAHHHVGTLVAVDGGAIDEANVEAQPRLHHVHCSATSNPASSPKRQGPQRIPLNAAHLSNILNAASQAYEEAITDRVVCIPWLQDALHL
jgi:hypothetical protein